MNDLQTAKVAKKHAVHPKLLSDGMLKVDSVARRWGRQTSSAIIAQGSIEIGSGLKSSCSIVHSQVVRSAQGKAVDGVGDHPWTRGTTRHGKTAVVKSKLNSNHAFTSHGG